MNSDILMEILSRLSRRLSREDRSIILFMENAPCHPEDLDDKFDKIKIVFFPKNTTSRLQPLDLAIIQAFKLKYYKRLLTHVVSKVDQCNSASDVCKSVDVLQAIRWTSMAWNDVSESTVVKCFIKVGMLDAEGNTNAVECSNSDVDPFAELQDEFAAVESLAKETSGACAVSMKETVNGSFDPPVCFELPDNWEDTFFREVALERGEETNVAGERGVSEDEIDEPPATVVPKIASYKEATSRLQEVLNFLEAKGNMKTANDLAKVIYSVQSDWLKQRRSQSKLTDFFKTV